MSESLWIPGVAVGEKLFRTVAIYFSLIIGLRLAGKRELAQLNSFDLVVLLLLSNTVQNAIIGSDTSVSGGLIGAATLITTNHMVVRLLNRHRKLARRIIGSPVILVSHGHVLKTNLVREGITDDELLLAVHRYGIQNIQDVEKAILETSGVISVIARPVVANVNLDRGFQERLARLERNLTLVVEHLEATQGQNSRPAEPAEPEKP
jgi:uncharacterized membrane protein YcaP (DUF421 family)